MPIELFSNNSTTTLAAPITTTGQTSISVTSSSGFPAAATGVSQFRVLIGSEILLVTDVSGTTWTVSRGMESTVPATYSTGETVAQIVTAGALANVQTPAAAGTVFVSGPTSYVDITYPTGRFSQMPMVTATVVPGTNNVPIVVNVSPSGTTSFRAYLYGVGTWSSGAISVMWIARAEG